MSRQISPAIEAEARAFRIWREGTSVGWDCTVRELAEALGIKTETVRRICRFRDWPVQAGQPGGKDDGSVVSFMRRAERTPRRPELNGQIDRLKTAIPSPIRKISGVWV
ncbi:hypothetical protein [Shimia sp.]|uniref:hypothetical protein n=1 Tax=Shimia sp. TaxID=1954381 RepID=UPI003298C2FB